MYNFTHLALRVTFYGVSKVNLIIVLFPYQEAELPKNHTHDRVYAAVFWCHKFQENHCLELTKIILLSMKEHNPSRCSKNYGDYSSLLVPQVSGKSLFRIDQITILPMTEHILIQKYLKMHHFFIINLVNNLIVDILGVDILAL